MLGAVADDHTSPGRVLHAPAEVAGQAAGAVRGLRLLGVHADLFAAPHPFGYESADIVPPAEPLGYARAVWHASVEHDTFHFHYGLTFQRHLHGLDVRALRLAGKRVVAEFHGSEIRMPSIESARNPYYVPHEAETDAGAERVMSRWASITGGHAIICDPALSVFVERHFEHIHRAGQRVDVGRYVPAPPAAQGDGPLIVVHAPSDIGLKGTRFVRRAADEVRGIDYIEISGASHSDAVEQLARADIVIDQLCLGSFGIVTLEAMSLAKPVICYLLPEYAASLPDDCPIINANPDTVAEVLAAWVGRRAELHDIGLASRAYVERHHDVTVAARRLLDAYRALPRGHR